MSRRNEEAREMRREKMKRDLGMTSVSLEEGHRRLTLDNHFGWRVLQKCQVGDGNIPRSPQLVQYHEEPDMYGPNYNKVTNILYVNGKEDMTVRLENGIQTSQMNVIDKPPSAKQEEKNSVLKEKKHHKINQTVPLQSSREESPKGRRMAKSQIIDTFFYKERGDSPERIVQPINVNGSCKVVESSPVEARMNTTDDLDHPGLDSIFSAKKEEKMEVILNLKETKCQRQARVKYINTFYYKERGNSLDSIVLPIDSKEASKPPESRSVGVSKSTSINVPRENHKVEKKMGWTALKCWQWRDGLDGEAVLYDRTIHRRPGSTTGEGDLSQELPFKNKYLYIPKRLARELEKETLSSKKNGHPHDSKSNVSTGA